MLRIPVGLTVAGRTDAGVHALGQVCSYDGPLPSLRSVNALAGRDVSVLSAEEMPDGFSARRDAIARAYEYRILNRASPSPFERRYALHVPGPLDLEVLDVCAAALRGHHDFTAFTPTETAHRIFERTVLAASWEREGDLVRFRIEAPAFMRKMNRILVGTMLEVARGERTVENFTKLLEGAPREAAGVTAPPHGLFLTGVRY